MNRDFVEAVHWASAELDGRPAVDRVVALPWSSTARLTRPDGVFWLKQAPETGWRAETQILTSLGPQAVLPELIAYDEALHCLLTVDVGSESAPTNALEEIRASSAEVRDLARLAGLQGRLELASAPLVADEIAAAVTVRNLYGVEGAVARDLRVHLKDVQPVLEQLDATYAQRGLVHGDLHPGNVVWRNGSAILLDWSDACIGDPVWDEASLAPSRSTLFTLLASLKQFRDLLRTPLTAMDASTSLEPDSLRSFVGASANRLMRACRDASV